MREALELEWAGIPTVPIIHRAMLPSAEAMKRLSGFPGYPFAIVDYPHPVIATWDIEETRQIAREVAPAVRALLVAPQTL